MDKSLKWTDSVPSESDSDSESDELVTTAYPVVALMTAAPPPMTAAPPPMTAAPTPMTAAPPPPPMTLVTGYLPPQGGPGYRHPSPQQSGYGCPPQQSGYGCPPPPPPQGGFGCPGQQPGFKYAPAPPKGVYGYPRLGYRYAPLRKSGCGGRGVGFLGGGGFNF